MIRILMLGDGSLTAVQRPLAWMLASGCRVWLMSGTDPYQRSPPANYGFLPLSTPALGEGYGAEAVGAGAAEVTRAVERIRPSLIHLHFLGFEATCCVAAGIRPHVLSVWGALNHLLKPKMTRNAAAPESTENKAVDPLVDFARTLILESPALAQAAAARYGAGKRIEMIPMGVDTRRFCPDNRSERAAWRKALQIPEDAFVMLSPRGWGQIYNHDKILRAFARARPRLRRPTLLAFSKMGRNTQTGEAPRVFNSVMELAESLGLRDAIRTLPCLRYEMMLGLYAMADAVVNFPLQDAFPSTLIEAAACERPILSANLPAYIGTFVETCCDLVEPENELALADAIVEFVNQPESSRREALIRGRTEILEHYDEHLCRALLLRLYTDLNRE
ncbi:glycosyltransferase [Thiohalocapsa marina]|nr:glycosyltransferase [Thiohalocapsa marina]